MLNFSSKPYPADILPNQKIATLFLYFLSCKNCWSQYYLTSFSFLSQPFNKYFLGTVFKISIILSLLNPSKVILWFKPPTSLTKIITRTLKRSPTSVTAKLPHALLSHFVQFFYSKVILMAIPLLVTLLKY